MCYLYFDKYSKMVDNPMTYDICYQFRNDVFTEYYHTVNIAIYFIIMYAYSGSNSGDPKRI